MKYLAFTFAASITISTVLPANALDVGLSEYVWLTQLGEEGYVPFPTSGATGELFGMTKSSSYYLCYAADNNLAAQLRAEQIRSEINGGAPDRKVQNIPIACVLTN